MPKHRKNVITGVFFLLIVAGLISCSDVSEVSPVAITSYPEHETESAKLYVAKCSGCHAAPLPAIHEARQWSGIVQRMQMRMTRKAIQPLNKQEFAIVVAYLEKHARK